MPQRRPAPAPLRSCRAILLGLAALGRAAAAPKAKDGSLECSYTKYANRESYHGHGAVAVDSGHSAEGAAECLALCDGDAGCDCVMYLHAAVGGRCWKVKGCVPSGFRPSSMHDMYMKGCPLSPSPLSAPAAVPAPVNATVKLAPVSRPPPSDGCFRGRGDYGVPLSDQKALASRFWPYRWGPPPYGTPGDIAGVLQIVNGGSSTMWVRYAGNGISQGQPYDWKPFITRPSALNGGIAHPWNALGTNGMLGQGDGFRLAPGEYQIVPFSSSACWVGGTLGCGTHGEGCAISPYGRGSGTSAVGPGQPNSLFEWTAPGVWDASLVDGFSLPMRVEVDGCGAPGSGSLSDCGGSDPVTYLSLQKDKCPNKILTPSGGYIGCKSMCGCQNQAKDLGADVDLACPRMAGLSSMENLPHPPGGYCGCPQGDCVPWLRDLFKRDAAGAAYCNAITGMAFNSRGQRAVYCQAYDDNAGTRSYGNGVIKVTFCNRDFEYVGEEGAGTRSASEGEQTVYV